MMDRKGCLNPRMNAQYIREVNNTLVRGQMGLTNALTAGPALRWGTNMPYPLFQWVFGLKISSSDSSRAVCRKTGSPAVRIFKSMVRNLNPL